MSKKFVSVDSFQEFISKLKNESENSQVSVCAGGGCIASGSLEIIKEFQKRNIHVKPVGCMGPCSTGPLIRINSDGTIYANVQIEDVDEICKSHIKEKQIIKRLLPAKIHKTDNEDKDFFSIQKKVVLSRCGEIDPLSIDEYIQHDGYSAFLKVLSSLSSDQVIDQLKISGLRGRGGAGFPTWMKWNFTKNASETEKYIICNADEGDPGAFMDRSILEGDPHSVIEGMLIAAKTIGSSRGFIYVRAEYPVAVARISAAIESAEKYGLLGKKILGSDFSFKLEIRMGSGAFVCGEETALMNSIEGRRGEPRPRPPFPANKGLWGKPSLLNNVETYVNVTMIILNGAENFRKAGSEKSGGTKIFALAGAVKNTGLVEVEIGTTLGELIYDIGGGIKNGKEFKAAQLGGPSGGCIPKQHLNVSLDYETVAELGAIMGSGGLIVLDEDSCMVDVARFFLDFVQDESCGKCTPCRVGTKRMLEILENICSGKGKEGDIEKLIEMSEIIKQTSLCGLGQTAPNPVLSTIRYFRNEYEEHIREKKCTAGVCPSLVRAPCQSACPAGVDIPGFVSLVGEKRYAEALRLHRERNPFASVCSRICFHTCEDKCRRASLDKPVAIRAIKRFMADQEIVAQVPEVRENKINASKKIAIIGAGPAGLSCGYFLARLGYRPVIFEKELRPGGMMVQTIPAYRLPRETLAKEIRMIENLGVEIRTNNELGRDFSISSLKEAGYESVFLGVGAAKGTSMGIPGEDKPQVIQGNDFLRQYNIRGSVPVGKKVIVIGGGNAAVDAARTAIRLGAEVVIVYRRTQGEMPAYAEEIEEALHEGVKLFPLLQPVEICGDGKVESLKCIHMQLGEFDRSGRRGPKEITNDVIELECDQVIIAIGQRLHMKEYSDLPELEYNDNRFIKCSTLTGATSIDWLFTGGDAARGPSSVVQAIGDGERAAFGIDLYLTGESHAFWRKEKVPDTFFDPEADPSEYEREAIRTIDVERRKFNFDEVELPWIESTALRQCQRCLRCDYGKISSSATEEYNG
ncbi:MAG: FAD-dependent oxidoreductase [Spirochaetes bacterium]|nr:FAD-dependent oxidoreductase [Spirochaetota bacterium]